VVWSDCLRLLEVFTIEKAVRELYWETFFRPCWIDLPAEVIVRLCLENKGFYEVEPDNGGDLK